MMERLRNSKFNVHFQIARKDCDKAGNGSLQYLQQLGQGSFNVCGLHVELMNDQIGIHFVEIFQECAGTQDFNSPRFQGRLRKVTFVVCNDDRSATSDRRSQNKYDMMPSMPRPPLSSMSDMASVCVDSSTCSSCGVP